MDVIDDLIESGYVKKPFIGIEGRNVSEDLAKQYNSKVGIYVDNIIEGSPAEKSELKAGDVITKIDDHKVETIQELNSYKAKNYEIGDEITLTVYRDGKEQNIKLTLGEQPKTEEKEDNKKQDSKKSKADTLKDYYDIIDDYYNYFYY